MSDGRSADCKSAAHTGIKGSIPLGDILTKDQIMTLLAYGKKVIVEPVILNKKGNIILPDQKPLRGLVVSAGPDVKDLGTGKTVYYAANSGNEIEVRDKKFLVLDKEDILAIE